MTANKLFFGDNLVVLRHDIPAESVDLVYLDPPFNSNATYNVLFKSPTGRAQEGGERGTGEAGQAALIRATMTAGERASERAFCSRGNRAGLEPRGPRLAWAPLCFLRHAHGEKRVQPS